MSGSYPGTANSSWVPTGTRLVVLGLTTFLGISVSSANEIPIAGSENFIVHGPSSTLATEVLERADKLRRDIAKQWFAKSLPGREPKTIIHFRLSDDTDEGLTWLADRRETKAHYMWLTTSRQRATGTTLAHEIAHICLAARFPNGMPAWANEGIASSYDDSERKATRQRILTGFTQRQDWPSLKELLVTRRIHPSNEEAYTTSASLVEFLLARQNRETLIQFVEDGQRQGWQRALREHYRIEAVDQLQQLWQNWVSSHTRAAAS